MITRALGIEPSVEVDLYPIQVHDGRPAPAVLRRADRHGRRVRDRAGARPTSTTRPRPRTGSSTRRTRAGGIDNITVLIVDLVDDGGVRPPPVPIVTDDQPAPAETPAEEPAEEAPEERRPRPDRPRPGPPVLADPALGAARRRRRSGVAVGVSTGTRITPTSSATTAGASPIFQGRPGGAPASGTRRSSSALAAARTLPAAERRRCGPATASSSSLGGREGVRPGLRAPGAAPATPAPHRAATTAPATTPTTVAPAPPAAP